jgi:hypothetical protein
MLMSEIFTVEDWISVVLTDEISGSPDSSDVMLSAFGSSPSPARDA